MLEIGVPLFLTIAMQCLFEGLRVMVAHAEKEELPRKKNTIFVVHFQIWASVNKEVQRTQKFYWYENDSLLGEVQK